MKIQVSFVLTIGTVLNCLIATESAGQYDTHLIDQRDGRTYKTVRIGTQTWMAENLNYGTIVNDCDQRDNGIVEKTFYQNDSAANLQYGALYTWNEAMDWQKSGTRGICPEGWHVPTLAEWRQLSLFLGADSAGQQLKASKGDSIPWDGNNRSIFGAIPAGVAYQNFFGRRGQWALFWSATEYDSNYAWFAQLDGFWYPQPPKYKILYLGNYYLKQNAFCIRCIKDSDE